MAEKSSRRGAVDLGIVLMVLSFVVIGYFLYWLQGQAAVERAAATVVEDPTGGAPDDPNEGMTRVPAADLVTGAGASALEGQVIRVEPTTVASLLGRQGFWLDVPQSPFLVSYSASLLADSATVTPGSRVTVTGTVTAMSDSVAASWFEAGRIGEGDQLAASFSSYFIEAQQIQTAPGGRGGN